MNYKELPLLKEELIKDYGYISFQLILGNIDVVAIRIKKSFEIVCITYKGGKKVGFIYERGNLAEEKVLMIYRDIPEDYNELPAFEKLRTEKIEILQMPKNNYVFVNEKEVRRIKK